jgi:hypothetical protein
MNTRPRISLPPLERTGPIRNWNTIIGARGGAAAPRDPIEAAVKVGYQVMEEFLSGGRRAAGSLRPPGFAPFGAGRETPEELGGRLMQSATDFVQVWMQMFEILLPRAPTPTAPSPTPPPSAGPSAPPADAPMRVRIGVASRRPTEVSVELRGAGIAPALVVHRLRSSDGTDEIPAIAVSASVQSEVLVIDIPVPDAQPAGRYNACIVDVNTGLPQGTLSLLICPEPRPAA